jgi:toxin-antitoxin system PIN domain toxin
VILVDANLLIYASNRSFPQYGPARRWLAGQLDHAPRVALPWASLLGFVRIVTNPRLFRRPLSPGDAWEQVEAWLNTPNVWIPQPTENHRPILARMLQSAGAGANLVPDAELAALAIEHGQTLCSTDGDFARFPGLKWMNPLAGQPPAPASPI